MLEGLPVNSVPDTEVELLQAWLVAKNPAQTAATLPDTEVPLLKLILAAYS